jgi:general secretion pathway protein A
MYEQFYGLKEKPFEITPDPRFLYMSEQHREAYAHLTYALNESKGFTVITGEVGTGKTTLIQMLLARLDGHTRTAHLFNPKLSTRDFLKYICHDLGLKTEGMTTKGELLMLLHNFLLECYARNERVVLIIDEAQTLSPKLLEEVRLLTNLETPKTKLLQVILMGQPELDTILADHRFRQLKQRISVRYHLKPLNRNETKEYIEKRLKVAGARDCHLFDEAAVREIYRRSSGIPRLINVLCDNALVTGYVEEKRPIDKQVIRDVAKDMEGPAMAQRPAWNYVFASVVFLIVIVGILFFWAREVSLGDMPSTLESAGNMFRARILRQ